MVTIPINFVDYGARCDALSRNSNVNCAVCLGRDYDQNKIISNSRPTYFAQDEISSSWLSQTDIIDQDDHHGRIWSWVFFLVSSVAPLAMGRPEKYDLLNVLPTNWCHVSWSYWQGIMSIYLTEEHATCPLFIYLCRCRCQGPLPINSWFPSLPSSFLKFSSSITLVLDPRLEVSCIHSFPSS